ncbi:MAG TPA: GNAT family N-acetyltransferase [Bryobacteraceae bacterium]|jgi:RimJ/RimL family protein N-acetyltransferase|nr:GNAT family N-acetyltransferase [Bryobacteraceae bacterium]
MEREPILAPLESCGPELEDLLRRASVANPFSTIEYGRAVQASGREVWIVGLTGDGTEANVTLGLIKTGRLSTEVELPSLPPVASDPEFWAVVDQLCRKRGVTDLVAESYGSAPFDLPPLRAETSRSTRREYIWRLDGKDLSGMLSADHRRNIKKAQKANVSIRRTRDKLDWLGDHMSLVIHSAQRRVARGESVALANEERLYRAFLESGAAELFQAVSGEKVLASLLVLLSPRSGYSHTTGSSAEGMTVGASRFLIKSIAEALQQDGRETFNLGGAVDGTSLSQFKLGFGAEPVVLPAAECYVGPVWKKKLRSAIRLWRSDPEAFSRSLTGSSLRLLVFSIETADTDAAANVSLSDVRLQFLDASALASLTSPADDPTFQARQLERLQRIGTSHAYGVYVGDELAHISWLMPASAVAMDDPIVLQLREDEMEITGCETLSGFRGRGIYPYAIQCLARIALEQGIRRIYMKTHESNTASERGILKAGLQPAGSVRIVQPPLLPSRTIVKRRLSVQQNLKQRQGT